MTLTSPLVLQVRLAGGGGEVERLDPAGGAHVVLQAGVRGADEHISKYIDICQQKKLC